MNETVDQQRIPFEIMRALDRNHILPETLNPGLTTEPEGNEIVIYETTDQGSRELARFGAWRLRPIDPHSALRAVQRAVERQPDEMRARLMVAVNGGGLEIDARPDSDTVSIVIRHEAGMLISYCHRSDVVPGWPASDIPTDEEKADPLNPDNWGPDDLGEMFYR